jgi:hypothetical protein
LLYHALRDLTQGVITGCVSQLIIHRLEVIEVD